MRNSLMSFFRGFFSIHCNLFKLIISALVLLILTSPANARNTLTITDAMGRSHAIDTDIDRVICSGSGCLRLLTYLQAQDRIVGVDSAEKGGLPFSAEARPYAVANPGFRDYPLFGGFRGQDSPELIAGLDPQPQLIFKTYASRDGRVDILEAKTGIPVIALGYGDLVHRREDLNQTLRVMGQALGVQDRAEEVISFFDSMQKDLKERSSGIPDEERPGTYIGGVAMRGGHGFQSTDTTYAPVNFINAGNVAGSLYSPEKGSDQVSLAKEKIIIWNPEIIFLDISTTRLDGAANGLEQLRSDHAYQILGAVREEQVYGVFPYNYYTQNFENIFANAYFIGKVLYPDRFEDIEPMEKAEEIATFLNGGPAFDIINDQFGGLGFSRIPIHR